MQVCMEASSYRLHQPITSPPHQPCAIAPDYLSLAVPLASIHLYCGLELAAKSRIAPHPIEKVQDGAIEIREHKLGYLPTYMCNEIM